MNNKKYFALALCLFACSPSVEQLAEQANAHYLKEEYELSIPLYEEVLTKDNNNADAMSKLTTAYTFAQRWADCIEMGRRSLSHNVFYETHLRVAQCYEGMGNQADALKAYAETYALFPDRLEAGKLAALFYFQAGNYQESARIFSAISEIPSPESEQFLYNAAASYEQLGAMDKAEAHYDKLLSKSPQHANGHYGKGSVLEKQGQMEKALKHYQQATQSNPQHLSAHYNLARLSAKLNQPSAVSAWEAYLKVAEKKTGQEAFVKEAQEYLKKVRGGV